MLERTNAHLRILINERDSLSLIKESELVDSIDIRYMNDLHRQDPLQCLQWSSLHCRAPQHR